jgi:hypothetical protein
MISAHLLHTLRTLPRADNLYLMQFLVSELAQEESDLLKPGLAYPVWSPYDSLPDTFYGLNGNIESNGNRAVFI